MILRHVSASARRGGFTLLEFLLAATLFGTIVGAFLTATSRSQALSDGQAVRLALESELIEVVGTLRRELERSGYAVDDVGNNFPLVFDAGACALPAFQHGGPGGDDAADSTELAFLVASDADGDDWPDLDPNNRVDWDAERRALLLVPNVNGLNDLVIRSTTAADRRLSSRVTRLTCERSATTGFAIPLRAVRISFTLSARDPDGRSIERTATEVFVLKNGGMDA